MTNANDFSVWSCLVSQSSENRFRLIIATRPCLFLFHSTTCTQPSLVSLLACWRLLLVNLHSSMSRQQNSVTWSSLAKPTFTSRYQRPLGHVVYIIAALNVTVTVCAFERPVKRKSESSQADNASREMQEAQTRRNCCLKKAKHSERHLVITDFSLTQSETQKNKNVIHVTESFI